MRVRFAPSPTGQLHIGGLRTALYNFLLARKHGGTFILRIEDTDRSRFVPDAEQDIIDSLRWAGMEFDEGPGKGGVHAPYHQSERFDLYKSAAEKLLADGRAYIAFDTPEDIDALRERLTTKENPAPKYDLSTRGSMTNSLTLSEDEVQRRLDAGDPHVVRLLVPEGETIRFHDLIRGEVAFDSTEVDDQILVKSDGMPTYHLANVVDDHAMEITHVIRGEEWLSSVPKHMLLYEYLGHKPPQMAHLPLILSPAGGKLSKRSADTLGIPLNVKQYREAGYEPEALVNFLAFLGWNPGTEQEVFSMEELIEAYTVQRTGQSGVQLDLNKLDWYNAQFIRRLSAKDIASRSRDAVEVAVGPVDEGKLLAVADLMRERITFANDLADSTYFFRGPDTYDETGLKKRWKEDSAELVGLYADLLESNASFTEASAEAAMRDLAETQGVGFAQIIHPVRLAVTGVTIGAGMFETLVVIGKEECVRRLREAAEALAPRPQSAAD